MISLTTIRPQLRRYLRSIAWLARDGLSGNGWRFFLIVVSNFVGVSTAASSMGLVILYVKWAADPYPIVIWGTEIGDAPTLWSLVIVGVTFPPRTDPSSEWYSELDHGGNGLEQEAADH